MALNYTNPGWTNDDEPYIDEDTLNDISDNLEEACDLIGNETMGTTATTITGAIKELVTRLGNTVVGTTITYAIKTMQDKLANIISYSGYFRASAGDSYIRAEAGSYITLWHDEQHLLALNKNAGDNYSTFAVNMGDQIIDFNDTLGFMDIYLEAAKTNRIYMANGSDSSYPARLLLRCSDMYFDMNKSTNQSYWQIGSAPVAIGLNASTNAVSVTAPGGMYINGARNGILSYSGSETTSAGGNFSMTFSKRCVVFAAYCNLADTLVIPYPVSGTGTSGATEWWFHVQSVSGSAVTSTSITAVVFYMNLE